MRYIGNIIYVSHRTYAELSVRFIRNRKGDTMSWQRYDKDHQEELKRKFEENSKYEWSEQKNGQPEAVAHSPYHLNDRKCAIVKMHCAFCGKEMYTDIRSYNLGLKYCCDYCASMAGTKVSTERNRKHRDKTCPVCGKEFTAARRDAKYCSKACKQMAYRKGIRPEESRPEGNDNKPDVPKTKMISLGDIKLFCLELDQEWWYMAEHVAFALHFLSTERTLKEYVEIEDQRLVQFSKNKDKLIPFINTSGLISLLLACRLPAAKKFRKAVVSKAMMKPVKSGSPTEWTDADRMLADPDYPLQVLMTITSTEDSKQK